MVNKSFCTLVKHGKPLFEFTSMENNHVPISDSFIGTAAEGAMVPYLNIYSIKEAVVCLPLASYISHHLQDIASTAICSLRHYSTSQVML